MMSYGQLFLTIRPVFAMIAIGALLRGVRLISEAGEDSLLNLAVAVQILLGTTALALFTIPCWIRFGLSFAGLAP